MHIIKLALYLLVLSCVQIPSSQTDPAEETDLEEEGSLAGSMHLTSPSESSLPSRPQSSSRRPAKRAKQLDEALLEYLSRPPASEHLSQKVGQKYLAKHKKAKLSFHSVN